jgi:hypothetical protein
VWVCVRVMTSRMLPDVDYCVSVDVMESNRLHYI